MTRGSTRRPRIKNLGELVSLVQRHDLRATPARLAVLSLLRAADKPMSHMDVSRHLGIHSPDRATIFRNLNQLAEAGLLRRIDIGDHIWRFIAIGDEPRELRAEFVCSNCGAIERVSRIEIWVDSEAPIAIVRKQVDIKLHGVCNSCSLR
jgi:Fur family ferric uptake transcriptional regulator